MAIILARNNIVDIPLGDTIIGVLLNRTIQGDVRVRPTNVTATIDITNHDIEGGSITNGISTPERIEIPAGGFGDVEFTFTAGDATVFSDGEEVIVSGLRARTDVNSNVTLTGIRLRGAVSGAPTATVLTVRLRNEDFGILPEGTIFLREDDNTADPANGLFGIAVESAETALEDEFILLHNGPSGGFTQQCKPGAGELEHVISGTTIIIPHHVNDVVQAVITDR